MSEGTGVVIGTESGGRPSKNALASRERRQRIAAAEAARA